MAESGGSGASLERVVGDLRSLSEDIESCAVISEPGRVLYSSQAPGVDRERSQAMLAALLGLSERMGREGNRGEFEQVRVATGDGHLLMVRLEGGGAVAATTGPEARVGLALYDMRNARSAISEAAKQSEGV